MNLNSTNKIIRLKYSLLFSSYLKFYTKYSIYIIVITPCYIIFKNVMSHVVPLIQLNKVATYEWNKVLYGTGE